MFCTEEPNEFTETGAFICLPAFLCADYYFRLVPTDERVTFELHSTCRCGIRECDYNNDSIMAAGKLFLFVSTARTGSNSGHFRNWMLAVELAWTATIIQQWLHVSIYTEVTSDVCCYHTGAVESYSVWMRRWHFNLVGAQMWSWHQLLTWIWDSADFHFATDCWPAPNTPVMTHSFHCSEVVGS